MSYKDNDLFCDQQVKSCVKKMRIWVIVSLWSYRFGTFYNYSSISEETYHCSHCRQL